MKVYSITSNPYNSYKNCCPRPNVQTPAAVNYNKNCDTVSFGMKVTEYLKMPKAADFAKYFDSGKATITKGRFWQTRKVPNGKMTSHFNRDGVRDLVEYHIEEDGVTRMLQIHNPDNPKKIRAIAQMITTDGNIETKLIQTSKIGNAEEAESVIQKKVKTTIDEKNWKRFEEISEEVLK